MRMISSSMSNFSRGPCGFDHVSFGLCTAADTIINPDTVKLTGRTIAPNQCSGP